MEIKLKKINKMLKKDQNKKTNKYEKKTSN